MISFLEIVRVNWFSHILKLMTCIRGPCSYQNLIFWADQVDHQGGLLFLAAVMHLLRVSQIPITHILLRSALEQLAEFQAGKGLCQLDLQTLDAHHLGEIPLETMKVLSGALRP